jgi:hypothetical protein
LINGLAPACLIYPTDSTGPTGKSDNDEVQHSSPISPAESGPDAGGPFVESLRIQVAAVVAQQAALGEREMRLVERESALARQEEQVAGRLEDQRRQLLDLQDQITAARAALREKRAAHATLAEQQRQELAAAREEAAELQRSAKSERWRLADLRRRMIARGRRHWQAERKQAEVREQRIYNQGKQVTTERSALAARIDEFNSQVEADKQRLAELWSSFDTERSQWQERRTTEDTAAAALVRDLARRAKAVVAAEQKTETDRAELIREIADRRHELDQLETRIGNARLRLVTQSADAIRPAAEIAVSEITALVSIAPSLLPVPSEREGILQRRTEQLAGVADELADQRLHLAEQIERMLLTQQAWHADRMAALRDLEIFANRFEARELDLDRRDRELQSARASVHAEYRMAAQLRLRLVAEQARAESRHTEQKNKLNARAAVLDARERTLMKQEDGWRSLLRRWGQRRRAEVLRLRAEQEACRQERGEWVSARTVWLRLATKLRDERRIVAARALAVEQSRAEAGNNPVAAKRVERLERQWFTHCETAAQYLERLQATLGAEAIRLDDLSRTVRQDLLANEARAAVLDNRAAEVEREEQLLTAERARMGGELDSARARQDAAELRAIVAKEEAERLAKLLIESPPVATQPSQAA